MIKREKSKRGRLISLAAVAAKKMVQKKYANKLKPLMPSLREKKRYLSFEIISKKSFDYKDVKDEIFESCQKLFGQKGLADAGLIMANALYKLNKGIIRVNNKNLDKLKVALAMIKQINKEKVIIKSVIASGMIKKAKQSISIET